MIQEIKMYELLTLIYGTAPVSFLVTKVSQQLALEEINFLRVQQSSAEISTWMIL